MIHEATYDSDLWKEAKQRMHSTITDAVNVSRKMEAKRLLLTHFSQRFGVTEGIGPHNIKADQNTIEYLTERAIFGLDFLNLQFEHLENAPMNIGLINRLIEKK